MKRMRITTNTNSHNSLFIYLLSSAANGQNYRVSMNTNYSISKTIHDRMNKKQQEKTRKMDKLRYFTLKHELLKYVYIYELHLQHKHIKLKGSG
jgi:hypothetical protein